MLWLPLNVHRPLSTFHRSPSTVHLIPSTPVHHIQSTTARPPSPGAQLSQPVMCTSGGGQTAFISTVRAHELRSLHTFSELCARSVGSTITTPRKMKETTGLILESVTSGSLSQNLQTTRTSSLSLLSRLLVFRTVLHDENIEAVQKHKRASFVALALAWQVQSMHNS